MTRLYIQPSFLNSCEEHGLWSGGNDQYRGDRSVDLATFDKNGRARVEAFSDDAIDSLKKRKTSIPIAERILPQAKRLTTLREQMLELEQSYRNDEMSITDYSLYRDVIVAKIERQEVLLKKAASLRPNRSETDELSEETPCSSYDVHYTNPPTPPSHWLDDFIAELPDTNCFKNFLKIALQVTRKAVEFSQATKRYIKILQEV